MNDKEKEAIHKIGENARKALEIIRERKNKEKRNGEIIYTDGGKEIIEYGITTINEDTFYRKRDLVFVQRDIAGIVLPNSVETIGKKAFYGYSKLERIEIPNSVTEIEEYAFCGCDMLVGLELPNSIRKLDGFAHCTSIESLKIPNTVTEICCNAFSGCTSLKSVDIPKSVNKIDGNPFPGCSPQFNVSPENENYMVVDGSLYTIDGRTIVSYIPKENETHFSVPKGVTTIGQGAFSSQMSLESVDIPGSVSRIKNAAFHMCKNLKTVNIQEGVTSLGVYAFGSCESLESITLPKTVTKVDTAAFSECKNLESITIKGDITKIEGFTFKDCEKLKSVNIPESVTEVGVLAFAYCKSLESIELPGGVAKIGDDAFKSCESLKSFTIPHGVTEICEQTFHECKNLLRLTIPSSVTKIGRSALGFTGIEEIYFCGKREELEKLEIDKWNYSMYSEKRRKIYYKGLFGYKLYRGVLKI